jgi:hypothetical protein
MIFDTDIVAVDVVDACFDVAALVAASSFEWVAE